MQQLTEPNDLLHFFYKYGVREIPISREGDITGKLVKSSVVQYLNRSENFESNIVTTIDELLEPVGPSFFEELKDDLREGSIKGIPIIRENGEVEQVVTPGVLDAREQASEFVDESKKREIYEGFLRDVPFPMALFRDGDLVFENEQWSTSTIDADWSTMEWNRGELSLKLALPGIFKRVMDGRERVSRGESINLRSILDAVETRLMELADEQAESVSEAAEILGLPRQTFNYRWDKKQETGETSS